MQRGYCSVATRYSPALVRQQAFSSPEATLKVILCTKACQGTLRHLSTPICTKTSPQAALLECLTATSVLQWMLSACRFR